MISSRELLELGCFYAAYLLRLCVTMQAHRTGDWNQHYTWEAHFSHAQIYNNLFFLYMKRYFIACISFYMTSPVILLTSTNSKRNRCSYNLHIHFRPSEVLMIYIVETPHCIISYVFFFFFFAFFFFFLFFLGRSGSNRWLYDLCAHNLSSLKMLPSKPR